MLATAQCLPCEWMVEVDQLFMCGCDRSSWVLSGQGLHSKFQPLANSLKGQENLDIDTKFH